MPAGKTLAVAATAAAAVVLVPVLLAVSALTTISADVGAACAGGAAGSQIPVLTPGGGELVGATEYWEGDSTGSTHFGSDPRESDLDRYPDSWAELSTLPYNPANNGAFTFADADALGALPYETPLRITFHGRSVIGYKRDIGYGPGPDARLDGHPYKIDIWKALGDRLGMGDSSQVVRIRRPPATGAGNLTHLTAQPPAGPPTATTGGQVPAGCIQAAFSGPLPLTRGSRARLLAGGKAAAPKHAPAPVKAIIAAGNSIAGTVYNLGGGHGYPLARVSPDGYDCSSAAAYLLHGAGLLDRTPVSGEMAAMWQPGYGRWVSILANAEHVYMYVAGLRWGTHPIAPGDTPQPTPGQIGWYAGRRDDLGFTPRHPKGL